MIVKENQQKCKKVLTMIQQDDMVNLIQQ